LGLRLVARGNFWGFVLGAEGFYSGAVVFRTGRNRLSDWVWVVVISGRRRGSGHRCGQMADAAEYIRWRAGGVEKIDISPHFFSTLLSWRQKIVGIKLMPRSLSSSSEEDKMYHMRFSEYGRRGQAVGIDGKNKYFPPFSRRGGKK